MSSSPHNLVGSFDSVHISIRPECLHLDAVWALPLGCHAKCWDQPNLEECQESWLLWGLYRLKRVRLRRSEHFENDTLLLWDPLTEAWSHALQGGRPDSVCYPSHPNHPLNIYFWSMVAYSRDSERTDSAKMLQSCSLTTGWIESKTWTKTRSCHIPLACYSESSD